MEFWIDQKKVRKIEASNETWLWGRLNQFEIVHIKYRLPCKFHPLTNDSNSDCDCGGVNGQTFARRKNFFADVQKNGNYSRFSLLISILPVSYLESRFAVINRNFNVNPKPEKISWIIHQSRKRQQKTAKHEKQLKWKWVIVYSSACQSIGKPAKKSEKRLNRVQFRVYY